MATASAHTRAAFGLGKTRQAGGRQGRRCGRGVREKGQGWETGPTGGSVVEDAQLERIDGRSAPGDSER